MATHRDRRILRRIPGQNASDGAGVRLKRSIGSSPALRLDPFLMLDAFSTEDPDDYIAGFPEHPHRGFETVTYMLDGRMQHRDHLGNTGDLGPGSVQWMTAGRGIIHSEMPRQSNGRMRGFQLWINLPAAEKMQPPHYRDIPAEQVPCTEAAPGVALRCIAGRITADDWSIEGAVDPTGKMSTQPLFCDIALTAEAALTLPLHEGHSAFVYPYEGDLRIAGEAADRHTASVLDAGTHVSLLAGDKAARCLLLAGRPIGEPVVQYGPFVMTSREEIEQALDDYRRGVLTA